jgi:hypothetical protein
MTTVSDTKIGRLRFKRNFRLELIDASERRIEHHKSMIRNYKEQVKALNREIGSILRPTVKLAGSAT